MNNLKKMLAVSLAATTAFSTSALAAYPDADDITNVDAVELLSTLNVLKGDLNGNFNPTSTVTRAEMAKMIFTIKNQGNDNADQFKGLINSFSDTKGHWAEGYINYCYNQGIINGLGNGKFNPNGNVTGLEAMKMCLTALGYTADSSGLTGADWEMNTLTLGLTTGLGADFTGTFAEAATRDDAAGMIANTLYANTVSVTASNVINADGSIGVVYNITEEATSLASKAMGLIKVTGKVVSSTAAAGLVMNVATSEDITAVATGSNVVISTDVDFTEFAGQDVVVLAGYKNGKTTVYGMTTATTTEVINAQYSDLVLSTAGEVTYGDVTFTMDQSLLTDVVANTEYYIYKNTADTSVSVVSTPVQVETVAYVGTSSMTVTNLPSISLTSTAYNLEDGLEVGDLVQVKYNEFTGVTDIFAIEEQTGTFTVYHSATAVTIGGTKYSYGSGVTPLTSTNLGTEYNFYAVGSVIYSYSVVEGEQTVENILLITNEGYKPADFDTNVVSKALLTDGTEVVINIAGVWDSTATNGAAYIPATVGGSSPADNIGGTDIEAGNLFAYTVDADGLYNLTAVNDNTHLAMTKLPYDVMFDNATVTYNKTFGALTISSEEYYIANDAVVYNVDGNNVSVMTGAEYKALEITDFTGLTVDVFVGASSYGKEAQLIFISGEINPVDDSTVTGLITSISDLTLDGTTSYYYVTVWNGTEEVTVKFASTLDTFVAGLSKGGVYKITADAGVVSAAADAVEVTGLNTVAITGYNSVDGKVYLDGNTQVAYSITEDTVIVNYDVTNNKGTAGSAVLVAGTDSTGEFYVNNAKITIDETTREVEYIIVSTNGDFGVSSVAK